MNVGKSIKIALINKDMLSQDLAAKMGVSPSYISGLANASKNPSIKTVMRIALAFGMPVSEFIALGE